MTPSANVTELEKTRLQILSDPSALDMSEVGRCPIGLTLSRVLDRPLTINDKPDVEQLARTHLGLDDEEFDALYRICAWPDDLRERWHAIPARRDMMNHPQGHIADDEGERAARAEVAAELLRRFVLAHRDYVAGSEGEYFYVAGGEEVPRRSTLDETLFETVATFYEDGALEHRIRRRKADGKLFDYESWVGSKTAREVRRQELDEKGRHEGP